MELRYRIIDEARHLFLRHGIKSMTMDDIANHLGISKRTLYEQFKDKEDLLEACMEMHSMRADDELQRIINSSENIITIMMKMYAKLLSDSNQVCKAFVYDLKKHYHHIYLAAEQQHYNRVDIFIPLVQRGIDEGFIREDINMEVCLWLVKSQFRSLMIGDFLPTDRFTHNEFARMSILNFLRGMATLQGYQLIDETMEQLKEKAM
ncbi:TetR family transcriptional regulator [Bacteroidia bacterium]|nr:TetR family transcriptional regulator [Bacteroidia bacterium]